MATLYLEVDTKKGSAEIVRLDSKIKQLGRSSERTSKSLSKLSKGFMRIGGFLIALNTAISTIKGLARISDEYKNINAKIKLVTGSTEELEAVQARLLEISNETGTSYTRNANAYSKLALATKGLGIGSKELLKINELMNKSLIVSGASQEEAASFVLQYTQALSSGKLAGDEFRSVMESNSYFMGLMAKRLNVSRAELRKMSREGKLTTDVLRDAMKGMSEDVDEDFAKMPKTIGRQWQTLINVFEQVVNKFTEMSDTGNIFGLVLSTLTYLVKAAPAYWDYFQSSIDAVAESIFAAGEKMYRFLTDFSRNLGKFLSKLNDNPFFGWAIPDGVKESFDDIADGYERAAEAMKELKDFEHDLRKKDLSEAIKNDINYTPITSTNALTDSEKKKKSSDEDDIKKQQEQLEKNRELWDKITYEALPEYEQALYRINENYDELKRGLLDLVDAGTITMEQADATLEQLNEKRIASIEKLKKSLKDNNDATKTSMEELNDISENIFSSMGGKMENFLTSSKKSWKSFGSFVEDILNDIYKALVRNLIMQKMFDTMANSGTDWVSSIGKALGGNVEEANDAIISPNGSIITTHPDDYLIATKNPQQLADNISGGSQGTPNVIVNIENNGSEEKDAYVSSKYDRMKNLVIDVVLNDKKDNGIITRTTKNAGI